MPDFDYLVAGGGPAGGAAARELARHCPEGSIALVGDEPHPPYERPPLSKDCLAQLAGGGDAPPRAMLGEREAWQAAGIHLLLGTRVAGIAPQARTVTLDDGRPLSYGKLLLATGTRARILPMDRGQSNLHYLRTHGDACRLATRLTAGARVVVIGGGFIGLEVAATACRLGCTVTVLEAGPRLMGRALPDTLARRFCDKFTHEGVSVRLGAAVQALEGADAVHAVVLADGASLPADVVVVGIGAVPNTELAQAAGLQVENGIVTDAQGRTSDPHIYAAGDVAQRPQELDSYPGFSARLEAWEPALDQALATAQAMLGRPAAPLRPPWMWSDQFAWNLQVAGHGGLADTEVCRELGKDAMAIFQLWQGRLVGAITLNSPREMSLARRALQNRARPDPARLADPAVPLREALGR
ncbi:Anthranilate 1,2-dioxygenase system ferredoxin--NAD(+) reductase component [Pigmentiphaga humi]|uniref:Anthranilate 1,2-dioxygenase system ferredoxin--NAD(+) reductase component n=1 Tax=Pigmentiphaga humi TaxID=2478468 RepID=A0A3P4B5B0_9BURK|nr:FAD-dependent oxidoreductase [Pigmentiphaga humi]VCU71484.1 Anthranilate 1,2-dioxygenase system ferredoxin--NAD(+) reductase component [Pigmentiphaga humi]